MRLGVNCKFDPFSYCQSQSGLSSNTLAPTFVPKTPLASDAILLKPGVGDYPFRVFSGNEAENTLDPRQRQFSLSSIVAQHHGGGGGIPGTSICFGSGGKGGIGIGPGLRSNTRPLSAASGGIPKQ